mgnify:CR=1 FL=1
MELKDFMEEDIKKLNSDIDYLKDELSMYYDDIVAVKREKEGLVSEHHSLESKISEVENRTRDLEDDLVMKDK